MLEKAAEMLYGIAEAVSRVFYTSLCVSESFRYRNVAQLDVFSNRDLMVLLLPHLVISLVVTLYVA